MQYTAVQMSSANVACTQLDDIRLQAVPLAACLQSHLQTALPPWYCEAVLSTCRQLIAGPDFQPAPLQHNGQLEGRQVGALQRDVACRMQVHRLGRRAAP